jgi:glycosyltransferase involved in cell wall biosynthesis
MKKIALITSGHPPTDERIFYKMGMTFIKYGYKVNIICSTLKVDKIADGIILKGFDGSKLSKKEKAKSFLSYLIEFSPDIVICCEPFTILPAYSYKKTKNKSAKIISDVTEWYPENVALKYKGIKKLISYAELYLFNIYCTNHADAIIAGEESKLKRYKVIAPQLKKEIICYYPILKLFNYSPPLFDGKNLTLCYAGVVTFERGILNLLEAAQKLSENNKSLSIRLKIVGKFPYEHEEKIFREKVRNIKDISIELISWGRYDEISEKISDADICFDLRLNTFVYRNSLPIKIFEYMASGKPVVYSDIKPIRKELNVEKFGFLVDPENIEEIVSKISLYIQDKDLLIKHSLEARKQIENKFKWEMVEEKLIRFIEN